jgi:integrase/recombinase XerD
MTPIAPHITAWLRQWLPVDREMSRHTCDSYAYAFMLLFSHMADKLKIAPSDIEFEQLDAPAILEFLEHLQQNRGNSGQTRNARLAAIRSFMRFMEHRKPDALDQIRRVLAIPSQRVDVDLLRHLEPDEAQILLDTPDPATRSGTRDRAMLHVALTAGLRVSELVSLPLEEIEFQGRYLDIRIRGKGRKQRGLRLWKVVADSVRAWLAVRGASNVPELFVNARGEALSRSGVEYILRKHAKVASMCCPSLTRKRISPHVLRHTCAMSVLQATGDIRKVALWLGHASIQTTEIYLSADPSERLETLEAVVPHSLRPGTFSPPDQLIAELQRR